MMAHEVYPLASLGRAQIPMLAQSICFTLIAGPSQRETLPKRPLLSNRGRLTADRRSTL